MISAVAFYADAFPVSAFGGGGRRRGTATCFPILFFIFLRLQCAERLDIGSTLRGALVCSWERVCVVSESVRRLSLPWEAAFFALRLQFAECKHPFEIHNAFLYIMRIGDTVVNAACHSVRRQSGFEFSDQYRAENSWFSHNAR